MKHGLLLIDKPSGCTSHDVVQVVRRHVGQKKVGHCGTLDPDATGLLVLTLGWGTRLTRFLIRAPKVYQGTIRFGRATDTYDGSGRTIREASTAAVTPDRIAAQMAEFVGSYDQRPPPYCAKKIGGVKYYELARRGEAVPDHTTEVQVFRFQALEPIDRESCGFELRCSSGTYARSLAHDLGQRLESAAHLAQLRRLQVGSFRVDNAMTLDEFQKDTMELETRSCWIAFDEIPLPFGEIQADGQQERRITHGQTVLVDRLEMEEGDWVRVIDENRRMVAVGTVIERVGSRGVSLVQPRIVFK